MGIICSWVGAKADMPQAIAQHPSWVSFEWSVS